MRIRLGIFEPSPSPGGPSRYVESILRALDPVEWDVILFADEHGPYAPSPGRTIVSIHQNQKSTRTPKTLREGWRRLTPRHVRLWSGFGRDCLRLARLFRAYDLDLLHTQCTGCEESAPAARMAGVPRILGTFHVDSTYDLKRRRGGFGHRMLECLSNHTLDYAIAVSEFARRDWIARTHVLPERVLTLHNGVDADYFSPGDRRAARDELELPQSAIVIGGVGRLEHAKGFDCLIRAMALLPKVHLALAGEGPLREELGRLAAGLGVAGRVHFLGFRGDVRTVYRALDVFAFPSCADALGYALLEAMAVGLPAVGASVGGIPEIIEPEKTGFLLDSRKAGIWAAALRRLLESPGLRDSFGQAARRRVCSQFQQSVMVGRTLEVYRQLLGRDSRRLAA